MVNLEKVSQKLLRNCYGILDIKKTIMDSTDKINKLILTRKDLNRKARELPLDEIQWYHIAESIDPFKRADVVKIVDENGQEKILKDRYESERI